MLRSVLNSCPRLFLAHKKNLPHRFLHQSKKSVNQPESKSTFDRSKMKEKREIVLDEDKTLFIAHLSHFPDIFRSIKESKCFVVLEGKILSKEAIYASEHFLTVNKVLVKADLKEEFESLVRNSPRYGHNVARLVHYVPINIFERISDVETSQGVIVLATLTPETGQMEVNNDSLPMTVVLDEVRDPGNMGAIIRTSAAIGVQSLVASQGCVDPWYSSKVLRAGMGGHFRINSIRSHVQFEQIGHFIPPTSLVLFADKRTDVLEQNKKVTEISEIPNLDYSQLSKLTTTGFDHVTLVIGNETRGISLLCYAHFLKWRKSNLYKVHIPIANDFDSLNCGIAFGILGYEIRKMLVARNENE